MTHEPHDAPFSPAAARAFLTGLRTGLIVLAGWLLHVFGEHRITRDVKREVRALLRQARDDLFCVLVETWAHALPAPPPEARRHDHRARYKVRSPTPSRRSAISLQRLLKRALPKSGASLRRRFVAVFLILRRFARMLARLRAQIAKRAKGAFALAEKRAVAERLRGGAGSA